MAKGRIYVEFDTLTYDSAAFIEMLGKNKKVKGVKEEKKSNSLAPVDRLFTLTITRPLGGGMRAGVVQQRSGGVVVSGSGLR